MKPETDVSAVARVLAKRMHIAVFGVPDIGDLRSLIEDARLVRSGIDDAITEAENFLKKHEQK